MNPLLPTAKPHKPVTCNGCNYSFAQDPIFEVACPVCKAKPGAYCSRPSEHSGPFVPFHKERDLLALEKGFYDHVGIEGKCGPNSNSERAKQILADFYSPKPKMLIQKLVHTSVYVQLSIY